jgi:hypothetical protein
MSETGKAPTSTSPLGNSDLVRPQPGSTGLNPYIKAKLREFPEQQRRVNELMREKAGKSGMAG